MGQSRRRPSVSFDYPEQRTTNLNHDEKLTVAEVDEVRHRYRHHSRDANCRVLAEEFGVSTTTIFNIVRERKWRFDDWQFRERSREPRNERYSMTKAELTLMERAINNLLTVDPNNAKALKWYNRYLLLQAHYDSKRGNQS